MADQDPYAFCLAVVGARTLLDERELSALLLALVNPYLGTHRVCLVSVGNDGPDVLPLARQMSWQVIYEPLLDRNTARQDCALVVLAHAVVVLGDPAPWRRLLRLCADARIPTRVYRTRPRLPPPRTYPVE